MAIADRGAGDRDGCTPEPMQLAQLTVRSLAYDSPPARLVMAAMLVDVDERSGPGESVAVDASVFQPPSGEFLVAMVDGEVAGCGAFARVDEGLAELMRMFVQPAWRRRGVGRMLLRELEERAWASGYVALRLETGRGQPEAIALYRSCGYRDIPRYPPHCDDELSLCMAKELSAPPFA